MTTVTSLTADRMLAIEAASVVSGTVDASGNLILTTKGGNQINAGKVTGPAGPQGPVGSDLQVLSAVPILDIGVPNQIRAGRQLSPADFAAIGLNPPLGLWNLSDLTDASGFGRNLQNKGAVPFAAGINGSANTAAQFNGQVGQSLYISDIGAGDPFRIRTGSIGCWFRTAMKNTLQVVMSKWAGGALNWMMRIDSAKNWMVGFISTTGGDAPSVTGSTIVTDDKWHFAVMVIDGSELKLYIDGVMENATQIGPAYTGGGGVFNISTNGADAANNGNQPHFGRVDEAFITADVLSEDQVRNLYCAKVPHTLAAIPSRLSLNVRRRRKGGALVASDFPTQPLRLHNFSAGSLGDEGANNIAMVNNGAAVNVAGADGASGNAFYFNGSQNLSASDAGLPAGTASRSVGAWVKTLSSVASYIISYGSTMFGFGIQNGGTLITTDGVTNITGPTICDGNWHFIVFTGDNAAIDTLKEKVYLDGRLIAELTTLGATVLGGANFFRIGCLSTGVSPFTGHIDGAFVCDYALTMAQILALYAKGSQALTPSPKNVGDHVEAMDAANLLVTFDSLDSQHQIDLKVAA